MQTIINRIYVVLCLINCRFSPRPLPSSEGLRCGPSCSLEINAWSCQTIVEIDLRPLNLGFLDKDNVVNKLMKRLSVEK